MADTLKLAFVGDICLGLSLRDRLSLPDGNPFAAVESILAPFDLRIGNLEFCIANEATLSSVAQNPMAVSTSQADVIADAGMNLVALANDRILDCGQAALHDTFSWLESRGIAYCGAGRNLQQAWALKTVDCRGWRLGFLAACDDSRYFATSHAGGIAPLFAEELLARVREAAAQVECLTVILHADLEFGDCPAPWRVKLARRLVDAGAKMVIQHHPHVLQGIENYRGGLIAYSLGNFVFAVHGNRYQGAISGVDQSVILSVELTRCNGQISLAWTALPVLISENNMTQPASPAQSQSILDSLASRSAYLLHPGLHRRRWFSRCHQELKKQLGLCYWSARRHGFRQGIADIVQLLGRTEHRRWIRGWLLRGR